MAKLVNYPFLIDNPRRWKIPIFYGPIAQLGERYNGIVEVKGSSPFGSTKQATIKPEWYRGIPFRL